MGGESPNSAECDHQETPPCAIAGGDEEASADQSAGAGASNGKACAAEEQSKGSAQHSEAEVGSSAQSSAGEQQLFCRSRDRKVLELAVWGILPRLKMVDQNLKILDANFQRLAASKPRSNAV